MAEMTCWFGIDPKNFFNKRNTGINFPHKRLLITKIGRNFIGFRQIGSFKENVENQAEATNN